MYVPQNDWYDEQENRHEKAKYGKIKKPQKSKHKHEYDPCYYKILGYNCLWAGKYCTICGKIEVKNILTKEQKPDKNDRVFVIEMDDKYLDFDSPKGDNP